MEGFLKTDGSAQIAPRLNGFQKIAIFLSEIGYEASELVISQLKLTTEEITKIRKEMQALGYYNPHNQFHVARENKVLTEAANFGIMHGIYREVPHVKPEDVKRNERIENIRKQSPEDMAKFLRLVLESK